MWSAVDIRSRFFAFFFVNYTKSIPCRVDNSEYIDQLRNHVRKGICRYHCSTTGFILYGWPNKELWTALLLIWEGTAFEEDGNIFEIK